MIKSRQNRRIQDIRRLRRCKGDCAVLEGPHLVSEAIAGGVELEELLATAAFLASDDGRRLQRLFPRPPTEVSPGLLDSLSDADSPKGLLAVARLPRAGVQALPAAAAISLYLDGVQDPGNLGALARVAEATGAAGLALGPGCAHPNHPRALRASAGSLLRMPAAVGVSAAELCEHLGPESPRWVGLVPTGGSPLFDTEVATPLVLALGAEGPGLSAAVDRLLDLRLSIPMARPVESLNVAVAAAVVLFELRRRARSGR